MIPPLARENVGITGMSQREQPSLSPRMGLNGSPRPLQASFLFSFLFFLLSAVYACLQAAEGQRPAVRQRKGREEREGEGRLRYGGLFKSVMAIAGTSCGRPSVQSSPVKSSENPFPFNSSDNIHIFLCLVSHRETSECVNVLMQLLPQALSARFNCYSQSMN